MSDIGEQWFDLQVCRRFSFPCAYSGIMTNTVAAPTDNRSVPDEDEYRQHTSADVAPELFGDRSDDR